MRYGSFRYDWVVAFRFRRFRVKSFRGLVYLIFILINGFRCVDEEIEVLVDKVICLVL